MPSSPRPALPPDVDPRALAPRVQRELEALGPRNRDAALRHLAAAGLLLDDDPEGAYQHAFAARALAARAPSVREAVGVTAYRSGRWAEAARELRAYGRLTGDGEHLPLIADCERAQGRPERAIEIAANPDTQRVSRATQVELRIVASGARRDRGEYAAALLELRGPDLADPDVRPWTPRLWYAYAEALLATGERAQALAWFQAVATIDEGGQTDADERAAALN